MMVHGGHVGFIFLPFRCKVKFGVCKMTSLANHDYIILPTFLGHDFKYRLVGRYQLVFKLIIISSVYIYIYMHMYFRLLMT